MSVHVIVLQNPIKDLHVSTRDVDTSGAANVKCISVMALASTILVVHGDIGDSKVGCAIDAHELDWRVLEVEARDGGFLQAVSIEELGLGLSSVCSFSVPPSGTVTIDNVAGCTSNGNVSARYGNKRSRPLFVAEGGGTFEDNFGTRIQSSEIEGCTRWDNDAAEDNSGTRRLGLASAGGVGEFTGGSAVLKLCSCSRDL